MFKISRRIEKSFIIWLNSVVYGTCSSTVGVLLSCIVSFATLLPLLPKWTDFERTLNEANTVTMHALRMETKTYFDTRIFACNLTKCICEGQLRLTLPNFESRCTHQRKNKRYINKQWIANWYEHEQINRWNIWWFLSLSYLPRSTLLIY